MRNSIGETILSAAFVSVHDAYQVWAPSYGHAGVNPMVGVVHRALRAHPADVMGKRVLELGCGTGDNLEFMLGQGAEALTGVDFSRAMLALAERRFLEAPVDLIQHDVRSRIPLWPRSADVTLISMLLEHIADPRPVFAEAYRLTAPGGRVVMAEVHPFMARQGAGMSRTRAGATESYPHLTADYLDAAEAAGLTLEKLREVVLSHDDVTRHPELAPFEGAPAVLMMSFRVYQ
jgi:ubiquinone/menaquinone biosynthesis C-methylase UbiE